MGHGDKGKLIFDGSKYFFWLLRASMKKMKKGSPPSTANGFLFRPVRFIGTLILFHKQKPNAASCEKWGVNFHRLYTNFPGLMDIRTRRISAGIITK